MTASPELPLFATGGRTLVSGESDADADALASSVAEPDRFTQIFDQHFRTIHAYVARRLGPDAADDIASETFLVAFRQRHRFDRRNGIVRGWLFGIATNLIRRHRRDEIRSWRAAAKLDPPVAAPAHDDLVAAKVTAQGASARLAAALADLSSKDREVLLLIALGELSYEETAAALGIAYGTVCSRLSRARRLVRTALGPADPNTEEL